MADTKPTLLFIPDISGFTDFVNTTEIDHSRHIITELLELIINSDQLGLTVSEIEGDAVLSYTDVVPLFEELIKQCEHTFKNFHSHLQRYDSERICRCGACETASQLSLKFIIHVGQVEVIKVKDRESLHGTDVIRAHKLLKNSIKDREYILISDSLKIESTATSPELPDPAILQKGLDSYDNLGEISYSYFSLKELHNQLPKATPITFPALSPQNVSFEFTINAPVDLVYENFTNFDKRVEWNEDIKDIILHGESLNQTGSLHTCLVGPYWLDIESIGRLEDEDKIVYGERLNKFKGLRDIISIFTFEKKGDHTIVKGEVDYKVKSLFGRFMKPFIKKMLLKQNEESLLKLKKVSEQHED